MSVCNGNTKGRWKTISASFIKMSAVFDKKDPQFRDLLHTLNTVSSELHCEGIGAQHKSASCAVGKGTAW